VPYLCQRFARLASSSAVVHGPLTSLPVPDGFYDADRRTSEILVRHDGVAVRCGPETLGTDETTWTVTVVLP